MHVSPLIDPSGFSYITTMAGGGGGFVSNGGAGKEYPGKMTAYVIFTCIIAACGGLIFGYDLGVSGGVTSMEPFLVKFFPKVYRQQSGDVSTNQYCKFNSVPLTLFTSSLYLAALVASFCASIVTRVFGRKISMLGGGVVFLAGAAVNAFAENVGMLILGRILLGIGIGFANQSVPLYLSEVAPYRYRGAFNIFFQLMITVGILIANLVNYGTDKISGGWGWRLSLGLAAVPALIISIGALFLPDTPNSMIERKKSEEAKKLLQRIRGIEDVDAEFSDLVAASEASQKVESPWRNILDTRYRPHLCMAILIPFFQQFTGMNVVTFYAPVLFKTIGFGNNASLLSAVITGLVNMFATFVAIFLADRKGRRFLFLAGGIQLFIFQMLVGILIWVKFGTDGIATIPKGYAALLVFCICMYVAAFAWSWGPLGWLVPSEIFPLEIRSAAQSINVSVNMLFTFIIAQVFLNMLCHFKFGLFFFFSGFVVIMTVYIYFFLPETKNIPIEEMSHVWKQHWYWGKFIPDEDVIGGDIRKPTGPTVV